jgi:hypothetical protein
MRESTAGGDPAGSGSSSEPTGTVAGRPRRLFKRAAMAIRFCSTIIMSAVSCAMATCACRMSCCNPVPTAYFADVTSRKSLRSSRVEAMITSARSMKASWK